MKVYGTDDKELIMEPSLKWAGNPNIIVAVKAFGLRATVQVSKRYFLLSLLHTHVRHPQKVLVI